MESWVMLMPKFAVAHVISIPQANAGAITLTHQSNALVGIGRKT
jgi:hypothetical protein